MIINKYNPYVYLFYIIVGLIAIMLIYYFSINNKYKLCALIPTIPVIGLFGLLLAFNNKENTKHYIKFHIKFLITTLIFYSIILFLITYNFPLLNSVLIAIIFWIFINLYNLYF